MSDDSTPVQQFAIDDLKDGDARWETGLIPERIRQEVMDRDGNTCRFCGQHAENPALHHVRYRSEGGKNRPDNLITVHWMYAPRCHEIMHSKKWKYQEAGLYVATRPGLTVLQVLRWQDVQERKRRR